LGILTQDESNSITDRRPFVILAEVADVKKDPLTSHPQETVAFLTRPLHDPGR
jgi:hypothetical protein